eukprot:SM000032S12085  [mRNA]  locus=s32:461460:464092:+ [translate_table: standard]
MSSDGGDYLDRGDNAWQMTAATLVGLQSIPGLMILYGGVVKKKWAVNSAFMVLYAFSAVLICWIGWGYKFAFGHKLLPFWGKPGPSVGGSYYMTQAFLPEANIVANYPMATMIYFQFVFAAITLVLIAGALLGRMNFLAWMIFVPLWLTFSYTIGAFSIWGGGFLFKWGVLDYSGGYVIHVSSGWAGFTAAAWVGPRLQRDRERFPPNNVLLVLAGAGLLWLGWNGFNGGDPYAANQDASVAVLNTNTCTAFSLLTWTAWDIIYFGKPSVIGAVQGMITGLVAITPAAGLIHGWGAMCFGFISGSVPWFTMMVLGKKLALLRIVDDTLGLLHTHGIAGVIGGCLTGLFAVEELCVAFALAPGTKGAFYGSGGQFGKQIVGALFIIGWNLVVTSIIMFAIKLVIPLRMSVEHLEIGDEAAHGEEAYAMYGDGDMDPGKTSGWYGYDVTHHGGTANPVGAPIATHGATHGPGDALG